jgi:three-Cys-motif partner protein
LTTRPREAANVIEVGGISARKANISSRTVRRVIARLEAEGHIAVHRGGGRAGSTNTYTVITGIHSPGQAVTPDNLPQGDSGDRGARTMPCQGTPATALSPDPPGNHQRTAATRSGDSPTGELPAGPVAADVGEFFERLAALSSRWLLTAGQRRRLTPAAAAAVAAGWTPDAGSAELILQVIKRFRHSRQVLAYFVEKQPNEHAALEAVVAEYGRQGLLVRALPGAVEDHPGTIIAAADGYPLFLFLDPCGAVVPFDQLATVIAGRRRSRRPQTELLLNFSAGLSRRAAGVLRAGRIDDPIIAKMDVTCGGRWWRTTALEALRSSSTGNFESAAAAVADEYAGRLARAGSMMAVTVPVGRRINRQPIFHLVFMTRSSYGVWIFADALAQARQEWLHAVGDAHGDDGGTLFTMADYMSQQIDADLAQAAKIVTANSGR